MYVLNHLDWVHDPNGTWREHTIKMIRSFALKVNHQEKTGWALTPALTVPSPQTPTPNPDRNPSPNSDSNSNSTA